MNKLSILIKESNKERINKLIKEVEGKSTARTIDYNIIINSIERLERRFELVHKKNLVGLYVKVDYHAHNYPKAYKYTPDSTQFGIERTQSGWRLIWVERRNQNKSKDTMFELYDMPEITKNALIKAYSEF